MRFQAGPKPYAWPGGARLALSVVVNVEEGAEASIRDGDKYPEPVDEMGIALISRFGQSDHIAGIDEQNDLLGVAAGKCLVSLLQHNELGLPEYPVYTMVEGRWVDRPTVRPVVVPMPA